MQERLITRVEEIAELSLAWDDAIAGRGLQADPYDSTAWLAAWARHLPDEARHLVCPTVVDGGGLVAALPAVRRGRSWSAAAERWRPRYRVVARDERPSDEALVALVETALRGGARRFALAALPSRDPATYALRRAMEWAGLRVATRRASEECLSPVQGGWPEHKKRFKKVDRTVKNFTNKASRLGPLEIEAWAADSEPLEEDVWKTYLDLHALGWKGPLREPTRSLRREWLEGASRLGWTRFFVARVSGVPAAAIVWLRLGSVAVASSTVYDERLAALSAGTIVMWRSHEHLFEEGPIALFDYLPGHGSQKDQLGPDRPSLIHLEAHRPQLFSFAVEPLLRTARRGRRKLDGLLRRSRSKRSVRATDSGRPPLTTFAPKAVERGAIRVEPVAPDPALEMYLTVAAGETSPAKARGRWGATDEWWRVGSPPADYVRLGPRDDAGRRLAKEVVLSDPGRDPVDVLEALAGGLGEELRARLARGGTAAGDADEVTSVRRSPLPPPGEGASSS